MKKSFCLVAHPVDELATPIAKTAAALDVLREEAKAVRVSGLLDGIRVKQVDVLSSVAGVPVVRFVIRGETVSAKPAESDAVIPRRGRRKE